MVAVAKHAMGAHDSLPSSEDPLDVSSVGGARFDSVEMSFDLAAGFFSG
jgi:hypothetical protein